MKRSLLYTSLLAAAALVGLSACTVAKLESRLEANPQCKDVVNPKTGALMPCPGSDRAFYVAAGVEAPRLAKTGAMTQTESIPAQPIKSDATAPSAVSTPAVKASISPQANTECKPQIHKKSGGLIPCLPPE
ncbi:hypothetical protein [Polynucleobacter alcilacus]|uniref:hypothetical protein n=1 Tax=Polynucleobacter alcilacus TaxID=1819739 RepID=UPI001C0DB892|nr:hypothetical protein [Polynucleobacter alcilacus]MBU3566777.1 hypothetical protein [Polynucleobacter alcilacus]